MEKVVSTDPIDCLGLSVRSYNLLRRAKIDTVGDLFSALENGYVEMIKGIGEKSLREITSVTNTYQIVNLEEIQTALEKVETLSDENLEDVVHEKLTIVSNALQEMIDWQKSALEKQIKVGLLHRKVLVCGKSLDKLIREGEVNRFQVSKIYSRVLDTIYITEELAYLTSKLSVRDLCILTARYGFSPQTYEVIGDDVGVTRERIRQILKRIENRIGDAVKDAIGKQTSSYSSKPVLVRMQTALYLGEQQGFEITYGNWAKSLIVSGLLGNWMIKDGFSGDPIELLIAICNLLSHIGIRRFSLPESLKYAVYLAAEEMPNVPAKNLQIIKTLPKKVRKEITRQTRFTGGVQAKWLSCEINYELRQTKDILLALGYKHIEGDWFIPKKVDVHRELSRFDVLDLCWLPRNKKKLTRAGREF